MIAAPLLGVALGLFQPAGDWASSIGDPESRAAMKLCLPALSARAGGEVASINLMSLAHSGSRTVLRGQMRILLRPAPPRPGEMAPMHIVNARFAFQCRLKGSKVVGTRITPLRD